jgi:hypothetical protein
VQGRQGRVVAARVDLRLVALPLAGRNHRRTDQVENALLLDHLVVVQNLPEGFTLEVLAGVHRLRRGGDLRRDGLLGREWG